jgi:hypothetical protein
MIYIPTLGRFTKNNLSNNYEKRVIIGEEVYRILIPFDKWNVLHTKSIQRWILRNKDTPDQPFQWGVFMKEESVSPIMVTDNLCEQCGMKLGCFKSKCRHMANCTATNMIIESKSVSSSTIINVGGEQKAIESSQPIFVNEAQNIVTTNNTQNYYIQNHIEIRALGNENPKWLTPTLLTQAILDINRAIPKLMEKKHFNDDFPENKNLKVANQRDINKRLQVFENGRWRLRDSKQTFYRVLVDIYEVLSDALSEEASIDGESDLPEEVKNFRRSERFLRKVERIRPIWEDFVRRYEDEDKNMRDDYWEDLKTLLLDRQLAIEQGFDN